MYDFSITNSFKKDFKKLDKEVQKFIRYNCFSEILENPLSGERLKGAEFKDIFKFATKFKNIDYRIIYTVNNDELIVIFVMIGSRENFYNRLANRVK